ncbi:MAG: type II secretion system F family protein [Leptospiraceae bacterium]|nr:type II secretion system F family protein [Leptospiraceae bacterium]MDW8307652.1 type II secretion system F family protein [Leptospiraceae bacterium]
MPVFHYTAFDQRGVRKEGLIEATSVSEAHNRLRAQNLYIKSLNEDKSSRDRELFPVLGRFFYRITRKEIGVLARQIGTLLGAGISLDEALTSVLEETENPALKKVILQMKQNITEGMSLSQAFGEHRDVFPPIYENMVRVGEATGSYEPTLHSLAELEEKSAELKGKAMTALIYPAIMLVISILVVLFLLTSVVPQIELMFATFKGELPLPTKMVLALSKIVQKYWPLMVFLVGGGSYLFYRYRKTPEGRLKTDAFFLRIPYFGTLIKKIVVGRFARNMGVLLDSNVPLLTALEITQGVIGNAVFEVELQRAAQQIKEGMSFRDALRDSRFLPQMARGMIAAGESSDRLAELLLKVASIMESEVETSVRRLTTSLEPAMIIFMGGIVAAIMASVMMPLYKMAELIK